MPKISTVLVLKYIKVLEFFKNHKIFLNKGTKHNKNYMEGLKSKNENIKGGGAPSNNKMLEVFLQTYLAMTTYVSV